MKDNYLRIGVITGPHGVHGEVKVYPTTDDIHRFEELDNVCMDTGKEYRILDIEQVKYFKGVLIIKFRQITDRTEAEKYRNKDLLVDREHAIPLADDEYFICDIIGAKVITDDGQDFGILKEVLQTGANDVYVVDRKDGKEVLLPVIPDCILNVDTEQKTVTAHIMKGLI